MTGIIWAVLALVVTPREPDPTPTPPATPIGTAG
jgi:hypothetical protein